jgi:hypothetical protein
VKVCPRSPKADAKRLSLISKMDLACVELTAALVRLQLLVFNTFRVISSTLPFSYHWAARQVIMSSKSYERQTNAYGTQAGTQVLRMA